MSLLARYFEPVLRILVMLGVTATALIALFFAWWFAVGSALGYLIYVALRRVLPHKRPPPRGGGGEVIEGEYRVEREDPP